MEIQNIREAIKNITEQLLKQAGFPAIVQIIETPNSQKNFFIAAIESDEDLRLLIGKSGQSLAALEHLVRAIAIRSLSIPSQEVNFILDIDDYRKSRATYVTKLARDTVQRVLATRRAEALMPMTAY